MKPLAHPIIHTACPFCGSNDIHFVISAHDHTVSQENFQIFHCNHCTNRFTQGYPDSLTIGAYYQSASYISHSDTQRGFVNSLYHLVRQFTLQSKRKLLNRSTGSRSGKLLEIGAGTGAFAQVMQQAGWEVTALEPDEAARRRALEKYRLTLLPAESLYSLPLSSFDVITLWHVLEHVHDLHGYLKHFADLLKPGGKLIMAVPNYTSQDAGHYGSHWAAYDVPRHLYHFSPKGMELLVGSKGFELKKIEPMWFDSFYVSMLSEQYKNGKRNLLKALWHGWRSNLAACVNHKKCSSLIYLFSKK